MDVIKWYCQPDGGQWNVKVNVVYSTIIDGEPVSLIVGRDLTGSVDCNGKGIAVVSDTDLYDIAQ